MIVTTSAKIIRIGVDLLVKSICPSAHITSNSIFAPFVVISALEIPVLHYFSSVCYPLEIFDALVLCFPPPFNSPRDNSNRFYFAYPAAAR
ncbi:hypothetical protein LENED_012037 [Lentinula edodes]|uniref:Uncharacterized protein n=1 Tax=Lentinula edodes TaxID=5353 RepID=A0A1Q3ERK1_LENED|nr:hypothetical protein LENED_012037 [Lentinula edodes]